MSGFFRRHRKGTAAAGTVAVAALAATAAWAYWTGGGSGAGSVKNAANAAPVTISQNASVGSLAPGSSVALSGSITNPNNTDIKVGTLTATITGVDGGAALSDFSITGNDVLVNAVVKKGTPIAWSGMTLNYANSAVNQDNGKGATVSINYTLAPYVEPPSTGTMTYVNQMLTLSNVAVWPTATGNYTPVATDVLAFKDTSPLGGGVCITVTSITQSVVGGVYNMTSAPWGYYHNGPLALKHTNGTCEVRSPIWNPLAP